MPAPANIRNRIAQLFDQAWDARQAGQDFRDADQFLVSGQDVILSVDYQVPREGRYHRLVIFVKWRPQI